MATYFFGASYNKEDVSQKFINAEGVYIGYSKNDAPPLHKLFEEVTAGDMVVLKAYSPSNGLYIKGIGICKDSETVYHHELNYGKRVKWFWSGNEKLGLFSDYYTNMRTGSLYVERNEQILKSVVDIFLKEGSKCFIHS